MKQTELSKKRKADRSAMPKSIESSAQSSSELPAGWQKTGEGIDAISTGPGGVIIRGGDCSIISTAKDGTKIVPDKHLSTKVNSPTDIRYNTPSGTRAMHPRNLSEGFSSAAFPKPATISQPDSDILTLVSMVKTVKEILSILSE